MPSYKVTYFNGKGKAENVRYLFVLADVAYDDYRIGDANSEKWQQLKPGMYGANNKEALAIDVVCETAEDFWPGFFKVYQAEEEKKGELRVELEQDCAAKVFANLEKLLKQNNGGSGWFIGDKITLADVVVFNTIYDFLPFGMKKKEGEMDLKDNEALKGFVQRFKSNEKIADWLKKRPVTEL